MREGINIPFHSNFAEKSQQIISSLFYPQTRGRAHVRKKSNPSRKSFPREIIISITELWLAGGIWRDIKKDQERFKRMILVRKLDTIAVQ